MQPSTIYCDTCGAANRPQARFCIACGQAMPTASPLPPTMQATPGGSSTPPTVLAGSTPSSPSLTGLLPAHSLLKQRYLILSRLGQGGMGAVYKAADTQLGDRLVAVKEMSQKGLDPQEVAEAAAAFKREALMLAGLFQRHLPRIYDHFSDAGRWYLVMDFIAGETLEEHLDKAGGKLPVEEVLDIGIQLATVLDYLHSHQPPIIFRDLKPANIMHTSEGDLFLIDFGIARHFKAGQAKDTIAYGSAGYAAPEQYGKAQTTPRSDIYSLGATLHHLLTGLDPSQSPFRFAPLTGTAIPTEFGTLIARMVDMDTGKRPASMTEVKQELQRIQRLTAQPQGSQLPPTQYAGGSSLPPTQLAPPTPAVPVQPAPSRMPPGASPPSPPKPVKASPPPGTVLCTYRGHSQGVTALAWAPDGKRIASAGSDGLVHVWDAANGGNGYTYRGHAQAFVTAVAWAPDGKRIASGSYDSTVQVWDADSGKKILTYRGHSDRVLGVAWSPRGNLIASTSRDKTVQVWDADSGKKILTYEAYSRLISSVHAVAWSPDGARIASAGTLDNNKLPVHVWDARTGKQLLMYKGHTDITRSLAWSPDGKRIASGSFDKTVQVWDAVHGMLLRTYFGHSDKVLGVAWSPDGRRIVSAGGYFDVLNPAKTERTGSESVQIWDATTGNTIYTYHSHTGTVLAVAWSPDGKRIASGSFDKTVQVRQAP